VDNNEGVLVMQAVLTKALILVVSIQVLSWAVTAAILNNATTDSNCQAIFGSSGLE
jgi:hypothetical protein